MYRIRLIKGLSYTDGKINATKAKPDVDVEEKADAIRYVNTGFFVLVEEQAKTDADQERVEGGKEEAAADQEGAADYFDADLFQEPEKPDLATVLQGKTVEELKAYAKGVSIDLTGLTKKQEIIDRIVEEQAKTDAARAALRGA